MTTEPTAGQKIDAAIAALGLTMTAVFVPWSQSRHKGEKHPSLNWRVTIKGAAREVLTTDYMAGSGHCPAYNDKRHGKGMTLNRERAIMYECENGRTADYAANAASKGRILPEFRDVLASLVMDSNVIDYATFEEWAREYGYDTDSRKAESVYRACLETALKLRNGIGETGLATLRDATQDY